MLMYYVKPRECNKQVLYGNILYSTAELFPTFRITDTWINAMQSNDIIINKKVIFYL